MRALVIQIHPSPTLPSVPAVRSERNQPAIRPSMKLTRPLRKVTLVKTIDGVPIRSIERYGEIIARSES
jgi:hypothetical protein